MTIPTRPAPPPPTNVNNNNLSQFQHQQQQQRQQQNGGVVPKLTIKLPPPPTKGGNGRNYATTSSIYRSNSNNSLASNSTTNLSSITRKFPAANVRYAPTTNWDGSPFEPMVNGKKIPPPRPPPPKRPPTPKSNGYTTPPAQSVNILSNLFGRKKSSKAPPRPSQRAGVLTAQNGTLYGINSSQSHTNSLFSFSTGTLTPSSESQLISFDSPPSSPTFTQKSNSDCVSVDSFSSDSNFSSPNNGSVSQPESGFEDDFSASRATTSPIDPWDAFGGTNENIYSGANTTLGSAPVRNYNVATNRIQQNTDNPLCNGKSLLPPPAALNMPTIIKPKISQKPKAPKPPTLEQARYNLAIGATRQQSQDADVSTPPSPPSPPMPNCPPPPPPPGGVSILDVIKGKADAMSLGAYCDVSADTGPAHGIALYDFDSDVEGDLSFRENEKIYILEKLNDEWLRGRNRSGCEGIFPINYIDIRVPLKDACTSTKTTKTSANAVSFSSSSYTNSYRQEEKQVTTSSNNSTTTTTKNTTVASYNPKQVQCLYTFDAGEPGDLVLQENDFITVLYRINEDWLFGETLDGRQGQFPANFLEHVPDNIPMP